MIQDFASVNTASGKQMCSIFLKWYEILKPQASTSKQQSTRSDGCTCGEDSLWRQRQPGARSRLCSWRYGGGKNRAHSTVSIFFIVMGELCPLWFILRISEMVFFYISLLYQSISPQGSNYSDSVFFQLNHIISYCFNTFYLLLKPWVFSPNFVIKICQIERAWYEVFKFHASKLLYSTVPSHLIR